VISSARWLRSSRFERSVPPEQPIRAPSGYSSGFVDKCNVFEDPAEPLPLSALESIAEPTYIYIYVYGRSDSNKVFSSEGAHKKNEYHKLWFVFECIVSVCGKNLFSSCCFVALALLWVSHVVFSANESCSIEARWCDSNMLCNSLLLNSISEARMCFDTRLREILELGGILFK
jgi:hypothetical protein